LSFHFVDLKPVFAAGIGTLSMELVDVLATVNDVTKIAINVAIGVATVLYILAKRKALNQNRKNNEPDN